MKIKTLTQILGGCRMKTKKCYLLEYDKLQTLIETQTGQPFDLCAEFEWCNDNSYVAYDLKSCRGSDLQDWVVFKTTGEIGIELYLGWTDLISGLIHDKVLPKGSYIIEVCW